MDRKFQATSYQYFVVVIGGMVANGIMSLPRAVAVDAGRDAWVVVLVTGALMTAAALLVHLLASWFPLQDPTEWAPTLLGKHLSKVWLALLAVKCLIFAYLTAKLYAGVLSLRILILTPPHVTALAIAALACLACLTYLRGLLRYSELVFALKFPMFLFLIAPLFLGKTYHLFPVLVETPFKSLAGAVPAATFSYVGFEILWFVYPYLKSKSAYLPIYPLLFTTALYTVTTMSAIIFFGPDRLGGMMLPTLSMLSILDLSVIERIDSLFLWIWVGTVTVTAATQFYIGARAVQSLAPRFEYRKVCFFLAGLLLVSVVPTVRLPRLYQWADLLGYFDVAVVIGSTLLFLPIAWLKKRRDRST